MPNALNTVSNAFHYLLSQTLVAAISNPMKHIALCDALAILSQAKSKLGE